MTGDKSHVGLMQCFYCGGDAGVALDTRLRDSLPRGPHVYDMTPCSQCEELMRQGVILIGVAGGDAEMDRVEDEQRRYSESSNEPARGLHTRNIPNPNRSGHFLAVTEDWVRRAIHPEELRNKLLQVRWTFVPQEICEQLDAQYRELRRQAERVP